MWRCAGGREGAPALEGPPGSSRCRFGALRCSTDVRHERQAPPSPPPRTPSSLPSDQAPRRPHPAPPSSARTALAPHWSRLPGAGGAARLSAAGSRPFPAACQPRAPCWGRSACRGAGSSSGSVPSRKGRGQRGGEPRADPEVPAWARGQRWGSGQARVRAPGPGRVFLCLRLGKRGLTGPMVRLGRRQLHTRPSPSHVAVGAPFPPPALLPSSRITAFHSQLSLRYFRSKRTLLVSIGNQAPPQDIPSSLLTSSFSSPCLNAAPAPPRPTLYAGCLWAGFAVPTPEAENESPVF